jgi:hypothetical protein
MVVMVDEHIRRSARTDPRVQYLLELLADSAIDAYLYSDGGPPSGTARPINIEDGVAAPAGWVEIRPAEQDRLRVVAWVKDGRPTERTVTIERSAFARVVVAEPPLEYTVAGIAETQRLADAHAMLAAETVRADLFVTDRLLPFALGRNEWSCVTLLHPDDALSVVGLYLRRQRRFILAHSPALGAPSRAVSEVARDRSFFYWEAAQLLLRDSWRWRLACDAHARAASDQTLPLLSTAVVHRLGQVLRSRDELIAATSVTQNMDTADDILNEMDMILVLLMAGFDSLARVCHTLFRMRGSIRAAGWQRADWVKDLKEHNEELANLFTTGSSGKALITLLTRLRNNIHGEALSATGVVPVVGAHALETFMGLPSTDRDEILAAIERLGGRELWGVDAPLTGYDLHIFPGNFVERLVAESIQLMNQIMITAPIEQLDGIEHPENLRTAAIPRSLLSEHLIWQLGLDAPIAHA